MKLLVTLWFFGALLSGCAMGPGHLYPVQGPLMKSNPPPVYNLTLNLIPMGTLNVSLPDGEVCKGNLQSIQPDDPNARQMSASWDQVYGSGFFVAQVLGSHNFNSAQLTGNRGTTLNVQFYDPRPDPSDVTGIKGVAIDDQGNLFKLTMSGGL